MKGFLRMVPLIVGVVIGAIIALFVALMGGCGPSPYPVCTAEQVAASRCQGSDVAICDGAHWVPVVDCARLWDASGTTKTKQCVDGDGKAVCR